MAKTRPVEERRACEEGDGDGVRRASSLQNAPLSIQRNEDEPNFHETCFVWC